MSRRSRALDLFKIRKGKAIFKLVPRRHKICDALQLDLC